MAEIQPLKFFFEGNEHGGVIFISMRNDDCKNIGKIVRVILLFHEQILNGEATYEDTFYNQIQYTYHL